MSPRDNLASKCQAPSLFRCLCVSANMAHHISRTVSVPHKRSSGLQPTCLTGIDCEEPSDSLHASHEGPHLHDNGMNAHLLTAKCEIIACIRGCVGQLPSFRAMLQKQDNLQGWDSSTQTRYQRRRSILQDCMSLPCSPQGSEASGAEMCYGHFSHVPPLLTYCKCCHQTTKAYPRQIQPGAVESLKQELASRQLCTWPLL